MAETEFDRERATNWVLVGTLTIAALACLIAGAAVAASSGNLGGWVSMALGVVLAALAAFQLRNQLRSRRAATRSDSDGAPPL
nr:hypothetical protein [uncultured organism]